MKVAILGGGACGLVLANILEQNQIEYEVFEKSLVGRKILSSGNGKANIANLNVTLDSYNQRFGYELVKEYQDRLFQFFKSIHLLTKKDEEGRIYPYSESSLSVLNCLLKNKLKLVENFAVTSITKINHKYYINSVRGPFDLVVLATGSMASFLPKKQDGFYSYLDTIHLPIRKPTPSLVGFQLDCDFKKIAGVRVKCRASLLKDEQRIHQELGEVILKTDGISGICILNLSSKYARLKDKSNCFISLDLLPDVHPFEEGYSDLEGILHPKLVNYFKEHHLNLDQVHHFKFLIKDVYDFEFAQVVSGGVPLDEINPNLTLKQDSNFYIGGELLDVDGMCGGYNLMFAFACGLKIGEEICNIKSNRLKS